jgi:predicted nucleic acid-binding protein
MLWRGRTDVRDSILAAIDVEPVSLAIAKLAGEAMARVRGATLADAIVMASAARRGDRVLTSDVRDLEKLGAYFTSVKVLGI